jgi:hypothetical protein
MLTAFLRRAARLVPRAGRCLGMKKAAPKDGLFHRVVWYA